MYLSFILFVCIFYAQFVAICNARPSEDERVKLWNEKNSWPPTWRHESNARKQMMAEREHEIMTQLVGVDERWENWLQQTQARMVPSFTESMCLFTYVIVYMS